LVVVEALDPNYKLAYAEEKWDPIDLEDSRAQLEEVVRLSNPRFFTLADKLEV
jgi:hypothetical protein